MVVVAMTSNPADVPHSFMIAQADLESGKLNRPGKVRVDKIYTLSQSIVSAIFGRVNKAVLEQIRKMTADLISD